METPTRSVDNPHKIWGRYAKILMWLKFNKDKHYKCAVRGPAREGLKHAARYHGIYISIKREPGEVWCRVRVLSLDESYDRIKLQNELKAKREAKRKALAQSV